MNFYQYLGLKQTATPEEIRHAFRNLAKVTHPDVNSQDTAFWDMVELNIIRDTLLNPLKRQAYDESLRVAPPNGPDQKAPKKDSVYKKFHSLFLYRCKVCGHEMHSTWRGYCLYHYLEATNQLDNDEYIFEYAGQRYQWVDPIPREHPHSQTTTYRQPVSSHYLALYITSIIAIIIFILLFVKLIIFQGVL